MIHSLASNNSRTNRIVFAMIVCSCNHLRDAEIKSAIRDQQCQRVKEVYCALGCETRCGGCSRAIAMMIETAGQGKEPTRREVANLEQAA